MRPKVWNNSILLVFYDVCIQPWQLAIIELSLRYVSSVYAMVDELTIRGCTKVWGHAEAGGRGLRSEGGAPAARQRGSTWEANSSLLHRSMLTGVPSRQPRTLPVLHWLKLHINYHVTNTDVNKGYSPLISFRLSEITWRSVNCTWRSILTKDCQIEVLNSANRPLMRTNYK